MTEQYMLLFSLGPVQSFIAQARKTRDLWLGSYLLSVLMEEAMRGMEKQLVFPAEPTISGKIPDLPNRYIAIYDKKDEAIYEARESEKRIIALWKSIYGDVWNKVIRGATLNNTDTKEIWARQVNPERFFEVFWVVVQGNRDDYANWLSETQVALAARKHLRHVRQENPTNDIKYMEVPEKGDKSTISGEREALRGTGKDIYRDSVRNFWQQLVIDKTLSSLDINRAGEERLDAIDTVKRFAYKSSTIGKKLNVVGETQQGAGFPSTSSIATASFVEQILRKGNEDTKRAFQEWLDVTTKDKLAITPPDTIPCLYNITPQESTLADIRVRDGDCYFPETFVAIRLEKDYNISKVNGYSSSVASRGQQGLRELLKGTDALGITRPTPYYAMVQMDGDKMGVLLGSVNQKDGEKEHRAISSALSTFSRGVKDQKIN